MTELIFRSPYIPLLIYMVVAIGGYLTCGDMCPEIIIRRDPAPDSKDLLMNSAKIMLLVCLVVGIIIRNQSNKAGLFGILEEFKKISDEDNAVTGTDPNPRVSYEQTLDNGSASASGKLSEEIQRASSQVLAERIDTTPTYIIVLVQMINSIIPAAVAILAKDNLVTYVEAGSGFLAPVFLIIYPCRLGLLKVSSRSDCIRKEWPPCRPRSTSWSGCTSWSQLSVPTRPSRSTPSSPTTS